MSSQFAQKLRERVNNSYSGSALMGGYMGGYMEGGIQRPVFTKAERDIRAASYHEKYPERKRPPMSEEQKAVLKAKLKAGRDLQNAKVLAWYDDYVATHNGKEPTAYMLKVARAKLALEKAEKAPEYKSKKGFTDAAKAKMSQQELSDYNTAANARNAAQNRMNAIATAAIRK